MVQTPITPKTLYPDSDGQPMADNTVQYRWIVRLVENLRRLLRDQTAFVAGDLLWYPVEVERGQQPPAQAPDVMVVLGRPDGDRGSYKQWQENNQPPQVVFEVLSPSNTHHEMAKKQIFYAEHGVLEMYFYDPDSRDFWGFVRQNPQDGCVLITPLNLPWVSPLLQIQFKLFDDGLDVLYPDGEPFKDLSDFAQERDQFKTEWEKSQQELAQSQQQQAKLLAKLAELGIDPSSL